MRLQSDASLSRWQFPNPTLALSQDLKALLVCFPCLQVMRDDGSGSYSDIISGMRWVKSHVQRNGFRQAVLSMSLGACSGQELLPCVPCLPLRRPASHSPSACF